MQTSAITPERFVIIGVGNPTRRDDGAGNAVIRDLQVRLEGSTDVRLMESSGDPAELLAAWTGVPVVIVVDASRSGAPPGTVTELDAAKGSSGHGLRRSTHAMGVMEAVQLGKALGRMPSQLRILAIEGADFGYGEGLSRSVEVAVAVLADRLFAEVETGLKREKR